MQQQALADTDRNFVVPLKKLSLADADEPVNGKLLTSSVVCRYGAGGLHALFLRSAHVQATGRSIMILEGVVLPQQMQPPLGELVVNLLREMIVTGQFKAGAHLKEAELAAALRVSRGPVRQALAQLEAEGHVELRRHRGAFVSTLTAVDVEEVYTLRGAIERLAAERACTRMGETEFAEMDSVLEQMKAAKVGVAPEEMVRLDLAFHDIVYAACEHQRVQRVWSSIRSQVSLFLHTRNLNFPDFHRIGYPEHLMLRTALSLADPEAARQAVDIHLSGAFERLKQLDLPQSRPAKHEELP